MRYLYLTSLLWALVITRNLDNNHYRCTLHEELVFKPPCGDYNCWEAQLLDFHRFIWPEIFNGFRGDVASGNCEGCFLNELYGNIFFLNWHWRLEYEAQKLMNQQGCPFSGSNRNYVLSQDPVADDHSAYGDVFANSVRYEYAATSFPHPNSEPDPWVLFNTYERNQSLNCFDEWDSNKKFRRAVMNYIGCAIISRNHITGMTGVGISVNDQRVTHILCVFASPVTNYSGIIVPQLSDAAACQTLTGLEHATLGNIAYLCAYENLINPEVEIPCQIYIIISAPKGTVFSPFQAPCEEASIIPSWRTYVNPHSGDSPIKHWTVTFKNGTSLTTEVTIVPGTAFTTLKPVSVFEVAAKPVKPKEAIVQLEPKMIKHGYEPKFCFIVVLIHLIIVSILFLTVSLILKFYAEGKYLQMVSKPT